MKERVFAIALCGLLLAAPAARAQTESVLHSFCSLEEGGTCLDGEYPMGGVIQGRDGNFYGITWSGGTGASILYGFAGSGTVFKITRSGTLTTLYSFCSQSGCAVGAFPYAAAIQGSDGNFYGTTDGRGANPSFAGTVFELTLTGTLTTLYSFCSVILSNGYCYDGPGPYGALIQATDGNFYGTSWLGGTNGGSGTVFKITPAGTLTILYPFCRKTGDRDKFCIDGEGPDSGVIQATNGKFYGTTTEGGNTVTGMLSISRRPVSSPHAARQIVPRDTLQG